MTTTQPEFVLEVDHLGYQYPGGVRALDDVCFSVAAGARVGVVGPSGAGKSTLLMHLNGLLPDNVSSGQAATNSVAVTVAGLPMTSPNLREIRRLVGFLFQDPDDQLFCPTVR